MRQWREACAGRPSPGCKPGSVTLPVTLDVFITFYASVLSPETEEGHVSTSKTLSCAIRFHEVFFTERCEGCKIT